MEVVRTLNAAFPFIASVCMGVAVFKMCYVAAFKMCYLFSKAQIPIIL